MANNTTSSGSQTSHAIDAFSVLINTDSGSVPQSSENKLREALPRDLSPDQIWTCTGSTLSDRLEEICAASPKCLVVWGGDGTVACALNRFIDSDTLILALPGGTMNLLHARIHGGSFEWRDCLKALKDYRTHRLSYGLAGDRKFYVGFIAGQLGQLTHFREAVRAHDYLEAIKALLSGENFDLSARIGFSVAQSPARAGAVKTAAVAAFLPPGPSQPFDLALINPDSLLDLAHAGLQALASDWKIADHVQHVRSYSAHLDEIGDLPIPVTLDGELTELKPPFELALYEDGPHTLSLAMT